MLHTKSQASKLIGFNLRDYFFYSVARNILLKKVLQHHLQCISGPGCSKLTTLVNVSLKFRMLISEICQYFFVEKNVRSFCNFATKISVDLV